MTKEWLYLCYDILYAAYTPGSSRYSFNKELLTIEKTNI